MNYCFISDHLQHSTASVYEFQKQLIKDKLPNVQKIHYSSDGCSGQYKNKYNFSNLCSHKNDFGIDAEWNFFATSHGKSPCDGIGGTLKRIAYQHSWRAVNSGFILNAMDFYSYVKENYSVNCIYVPSKVIHATELFLKSDRFHRACTVVGTKSYHKYVPQSEFQLKAFHTSKDENFVVHDIYSAKSNIDSELDLPTDDLIVGSYVSCLYDRKCYIGIVKSTCEEFGDYHVNFLTVVSNSDTNLKFPSKQDKCWVEPSNVLKLLSAPNVIAATSIVYKFSKTEISKSQQMAKSRVKEMEKQIAKRKKKN